MKWWLLLLPVVAILTLCGRYDHYYTAEDILIENNQLTLILRDYSNYTFAFGPNSSSSGQGSSQLLKVHWTDFESEECSTNITRLPKKLGGVFSRAIIVGDKTIIKAGNGATGQDFIVFSSGSPQGEVIKCNDKYPCMLFSNNRQWYIYGDKLYSGITWKPVTELRSDAYKEFKRNAEMLEKHRIRAKYEVADDGKYIVSRNLIYDIKNDRFYSIKIPAEYSGKYRGINRIIPLSDKKIRFLYSSKSDPKNYYSPFSTLMYSHPEKETHNLGYDVPSMGITPSHWDFDKGVTIGAGVFPDGSPVLSFYKHRSKKVIREVVEKKLCFNESEK